MPSGKTHDIITATTTPIMGFIAFKTVDIETTIIFVISYIFASLMFNGDLDIKSRPYRRWLILRWIWIPYREIFQHRSIWTHGIIIGTLIRLIYIMPLIFLIYHILPIDLIQINWYNVLIILIGLELGSIIHTISDKIYSI